ncbi:hypothetical protein LguiB_029681 [Lonicera macranthoides]
MELINKGKKSSATSSEQLQSQAHIWNHLFNFINSMSLKCAIQLNIPDIIHTHARPMTLSHLLQALAINTSKATHIYRLMRILTHSGFFTTSKIQESGEENQEEGYLLTPACRLLLKDESTSVTPFLLAMLDPALADPWHCMSRWFENEDKNAFETFHGRTLWDHMGSDERLCCLFNDAMASDAALIGRVVVKECGRVFDGVGSVVDVGGSTGTMAKTVAGAFPEVKWTVLDLPQVVAGLEGGKNLRFVSGDMFESIPNADAVLLKWILHDWNDEDCVKILKKCREAIPSKDEGGKVIIIEMIVDNRNPDKDSIENQLFFDMLMMVLATGRERNEKEWEKLFLDAGFSEHKITPLGLRSLIEVYP